MSAATDDALSWFDTSRTAN